MPSLPRDVALYGGASAVDVRSQNPRSATADIMTSTVSALTALRRSGRGTTTLIECLRHSYHVALFEEVDRD